MFSLYNDQYWEILGASMAAKLVATSVSYPHEVLRARLQDTRFTKPSATAGAAAHASPVAPTPSASAVAASSSSPAVVAASSSSSSSSSSSTSHISRAGVGGQNNCTAATHTRRATSRTNSTITSSTTMHSGNKASAPILTPAPSMMQRVLRGHNLFSVLMQIIRTEGVLSLWSGLQVNLVRIMPATATTFLAYEYLSRYLNNSKFLN